MSPSDSRLRSEQGMALIGVMLLLILASGICATLAVSGRTETLAAYNLDTSAQARAAAQAGLTAASQVVIKYLDTTALDLDVAMDRLLAGPDNNAANIGDNGSLWSIDGTPTGLPAPAFTLGLNNIPGVTFSVAVLDDDNWAARNVSPAGSTANIDENGALWDDDNKKIVLRAVGYGRNHSKVTLEGILARPQLGGIVVGGDLRMMGSSGSISGEGGSVHANGDIRVSGSPNVDGTVSAGGTVTGSPDAEAILSGAPKVEIPEINAIDFRDDADWSLNSGGMVQKRVGGSFVDWCNAASATCTSAANGGVSHSSGTWSIKAAASGRYYAVGDVQSGADFNATIYATGDIDIGNNDDITAAASAQGIALVADGNINIGGGANVTGCIYAREEIDFGGNHIIIGQVIAENRSNPNAENRFHGNVDIIWNGDTKIGSIGLSSWREVK